MAADPPERSTFKTRLDDRLGILRVLPAVGWPTIVGGVVLQLLIGGLPVGFAVSTSYLIGGVPAAVQGGSGSPAAHHVEVLLALAAGFFIVQQVLAPLQALLVMRVTRRFDGVA